MTGIKYGSISTKEDVKSEDGANAGHQNAGFVAVAIKEEGDKVKNAAEPSIGEKKEPRAGSVRRQRQWSRLEVAIFKTERYSCLPLVGLAVTFAQLYLFFDYQIRTGGEGPVSDHEVKVSTIETSLLKHKVRCYFQGYAEMVAGCLSFRLNYDPGVVLDLWRHLTYALVNFWWGDIIFNVSVGVFIGNDIERSQGHLR